MEYIAEFFPPSVLFSAELRSIPVLHSELRNLLDRRGAILTQHSSRRILMTLSTNLYEEEEDKNAAVEIVRKVISSGRRAPIQANERALAANSPDSLIPQSLSSSSEKVAHNVAKRFRDKDKNFSGELGQCWQEYGDEYRQMSRDYKLSQEKKLHYLHNLLFGDAKQYYLDVFDVYSTSFQQAVDMVEREHNSHVRQNKVKNLLKSLRMSRFVSEGLEASEALEKVYKAITRLSRQAPVSHWGMHTKSTSFHSQLPGMTGQLSRCPVSLLTC